MALPSHEVIAFGRARDAINNQYQTGLVGLEDRLSRINLDQQVQTDQLTRRLGRQRQLLPGAFAGRGLLNSGIYQRGLREFTDDRFDAQANLARDFASKRGDIFADIQGLDASRAIQLANVDLDQAARRSAVASLVQSVI